jgi:acyloxyacyl hydrolase
VRSFYLKLWENNHCNFKDYQCIAVNGMRASAMTTTILTVGRNQTVDQPAFVTYALVGNDVCTSHPGVYTTPDEMYDSVTTTMQYLDTILPKGSKVVIMGLVDGRILYEAMANLIHPIGSTFNDVTYAQFYDYMNCLGISPCFGWMNTDATVRVPHKFVLQFSIFLFDF